MDDWLDVAKDIEDKEQAKKLQEEEQRKARLNEILRTEKSWIETVQKRIQEIGQKGIKISVAQTPNKMQLSHRGIADLEFISHLCFAVTYHNVKDSTNLVLRHPITVHHHRTVRFRELTSENLEEILKFVVLGMKKYCQMARSSRLEHNLTSVIDIQNKEEHVTI